jgi:hypothetical protein
MSITDTQLSDARADWIGRGLDADAFDRALTGQLAPPPADPPPGNAPASSPAAPAHAWSDDHARELVADLKSRSVPDASIRSALAADGFRPDEIDVLLAPPAADTRSDDEKALDRAGLNAGKGADFRAVDYIGRAPDGVDLHAFNADAVAFMQAVAAPALLGPSLVEETLDAAKSYAALPEAHRELYHRQEESRVVDLWGAEKAREAYAKTAELLKSDAIPLPFLTWLKNSGALRRADVIVQLANIADLAGVRASVKGGATIDGLLSPR